MVQFSTFNTYDINKSLFDIKFGHAFPVKPKVYFPYCDMIRKSAGDFESIKVFL